VGWTGRFLATTILATSLAAFAAAAQIATPTANPIKIFVDTTRAPQKILHAHLQMPVQPGPLTLFYPEWIPGEHMPDGPIINVAGLIFTANGKQLPWHRDLSDAFTFYLTIPDGTKTLDVDLDFLLSAPAEGFSAGASATAYLNVLSWNQLVLYPAGIAAKDLTFAPSLRLPSGWKFGTALPGAKQSGDNVEFAPVSLETLIDSPVIAGRYFRAIDLSPGQQPTHEMDIAADSAADLAMPPEMEAHFRQLVAETGALFGARHYRDYHYLVTLSDQVAHFGLEHHESSDDRTDEHSLTDDASRIYFADLIPHEFVHSWNGKYRRPQDLLSPDYHHPMKDDLLWVYEGLTEYLGEVLTGRSGLRTDEQSREELARLAATYENRPGRAWRSLQDTADSGTFLYNAGGDWGNYRRGVDFYYEGELLWLDVDTMIRKLSANKKSLDDFCRAFEGGSGGQPEVKPYTFEDVAAALNSVTPYDWAGFLRARLDSFAPQTPQESIQQSGWKIVYNDTPNTMLENLETNHKYTSLSLSIGLVLQADGTVVDAVYNGPAYKAGIGPGMKVTAVNSEQYSADAIRNAVKAAESSSDPISLIVSNGPEIHTYSIDYHGGLRYPHIERINGQPDYLSDILRAKAH